MKFLVSLILCTTMINAPIPPRPKELTKELLVGTWKYNGGEYAKGVVVFDSDNNYVLVRDDGNVYYGTWKLESDNVLILSEYWKNETFNNPVGPTFKKIVFDMSKYPYLKGIEGSAFLYLLTNPKRE